MNDEGYGAIVTPSKAALMNGQTLWLRALHPAPYMPPGAEDIENFPPSWWVDDPNFSAWTVTLWNGRPQILFDDVDDAPPTVNATLQLSPTGEHWPFISLTADRARTLAAHLLAAAEWADRRDRAEEGA